MATNDDDQRPNPWGKPKNDKQGPSAPNRGSDWGRNPDDVDLEAILRKARANFDKVTGGGTGQHNFGRSLGLGLLVAVFIWLASGLYFIQPSENGVVLTFGRYTRTDETPGPKWKMPWPIQSVKVVNVTNERRIQIGYNSGDTGYNNSNVNSAHQESLMLTGDENIVDINFVVLWRISSAKDFLYSIRDPEDTISMVAASTMREIIGQNNIQPVLTDARTKIQSDARVLMQKLLDEYHSGIVINNVQLQKVDPPAAVVDAFNEVQRARQKKEELRNLAEAYRNDIIPRAKGESEKLRQGAEAYKQEVVDRATGDAKRFDSVYTAYKNASDVTAKRMYIETMEQVLKNAKTTILAGKDSGASTYLPLGEVKRLEPATPAKK